MPQLGLNEDSPIRFVKGIGPKFEGSYAKLGLTQVGDLWFHLPLRYEDRTRITPIADLISGVEAQIEGDIVEGGVRLRGRRQYVAEVEDGSSGRAMIRLLHFNAGQAEQLRVGARVRLFGTPRQTLYHWEFVHPRYKILLGDGPVAVEDALTAVYPTTEGLGQDHLRRCIGTALDQLPDDAALELIPPSLRARFALPSLREALVFCHRPPPETSAELLLERRSPAQRRLAFEELLAHQIAMQLNRQRFRRHQAPALTPDGELLRAFIASLPYTLTGAQQRVISEIAADLKQVEPMLRLVQGDVGAGKTAVAAACALIAIEAGWQVALVAPTELLAEQHARSFRQWFEPLGLDVVWLAGKVTGKARIKALAQIADGAAMTVGTHALMQEGVEFAKVGLVVIDEQHRFGVQQRLSLRDKGRVAGVVPHQLVMTATPIPRTLAMASYADLDISTLNELPPGRTPVRTVAVSMDRRDEIIARIREACAAGAQAYWVNTLIEANEALDAKAAEETAQSLIEALPGLRIGLVHGRLKPKEKAAQMEAFASGQTQLLVATTVIEVGVDVPNASLMVIENPERLGLSQLHQLRGRVGRGSAVSSCVLLYQTPLSAGARARLNVLRETNDGFKIAEEDLRLRGPGELLGTRQTGHVGFRVADLQHDADLLPQVQVASQLMMKDPSAPIDRLVRRWIGNAERFAQA